ncbi:Uncharacterised protein [Helicobacter acinonychis]|nr:Uncharacterised protein [Helicobacter acinonychis]
MHPRYKGFSGPLFYKSLRLSKSLKELIAWYNKNQFFIIKIPAILSHCQPYFKATFNDLLGLLGSIFCTNNRHNAHGVKNFDDC